MDELRDAIDLATDGAKLAGTARDLIASIKSGKSDQKGIEFREQIIALQGIILDLQTLQFTTKVELQRLHEAELVRQRAADKFARYELFEPTPGRYVHRLKKSEADGEPLHLICTSCRASEVKAILTINATADSYVTGFGVGGLSLIHI